METQKKRIRHWKLPQEPGDTHSEIEMDSSSDEEKPPGSSEKSPEVLKRVLQQSLSEAQMMDDEVDFDASPEELPFSDITSASPKSTFDEVDMAPVPEIAPNVARESSEGSPIVSNLAFDSFCEQMFAFKYTLLSSFHQQF